MEKVSFGNFFEDFTYGQVIRHSTPRTMTTGDTSLYSALYGSRFAIQSSDVFANSVNFPRSPVDDLLVFNVVFGKSVPDISLNAIANLGYAEGRFFAPVYPGDTISAMSKVIGLKENSNGKTGIVYVETTGHNQNSEKVLSYKRWVMVGKRNESPVRSSGKVPKLKTAVSPENLCTDIPVLDINSWNLELSGSQQLWEGYEPGEKINHVDGMTVEEAEHQIATRLFQNTARVHFNQFKERNNRFKRRLIYGGHAISTARALSFNGLANAFHVAAINSGRHVSPLFAGDTIFAWSEIVDKAELPERSDLGVLRIRTVATKDCDCSDFPYQDTEGNFLPNVILEFDYWAAIPRSNSE